MAAGMTAPVIQMPSGGASGTAHVFGASQGTLPTFTVEVFGSKAYDQTVADPQRSSSVDRWGL
jgi:hypothetical protein